MNKTPLWQHSGVFSWLRQFAGTWLVVRMSLALAKKPLLVSQQWKLLFEAAWRAPQHPTNEYFRGLSGGNGCSGWG
jgi:hypothetical protein